jgi:P4 family phage/plasmid primase-like protien
MREARELFYDADFLEKQDSNVYLLGFNNGIYDFQERRFRPGRPDDYVVKNTKIDYKPIEKISSELLNEVRLFMEQLFPVAELREYMWEHLASTLIGTIENQTFNIYNGSGRNGKSVLVALMTKVLGEYKGTVPITLITQKRNSIGSTSSELVQLQGIRYAVMQEPSKGMSMNEGIMKEITGGDPIQGRALFKDSVTFNPHFKLVVCTNTLFEIKSNDDGTWRRIRVVEFQSKFKDNPVDNDPDEPYQFKVDKKLEEKFDKWKIAMMALLLERVKVTNGNVTDCDMVLSKSNEYRNGQDYLAEFIKEKIAECPEGKVKKTEVYNEFKEWYTLQYGRNIPKGKELYDVLNKKYGRYKNGWHGIEILYEMEEEEF